MPLFILGFILRNTLEYFLIAGQITLCNKPLTIKKIVVFFIKSFWGSSTLALPFILPLDKNVQEVKCTVYERLYPEGFLVTNGYLWVMATEKLKFSIQITLAYKNTLWHGLCSDTVLRLFSYKYTYFDAKFEYFPRPTLYE